VKEVSRSAERAIEATHRVSAIELTRVTREVLRAAGLSPEHAATVREAPVEAELRGHWNHGVPLLLDI